MKKRYLVLSGLIALTLAACSQEKPATTEVKSSTEQKTVQEGEKEIYDEHDDFDLLKYLEKYNLRIGQTITFIQYDSFAQAYLLKTETQEIQINPMIAQQIYVEKL